MLWNHHGNISRTAISKAGIKVNLERKGEFHGGGALYKWNKRKQRLLRGEPWVHWLGLEVNEVSPCSTAATWEPVWHWTKATSCVQLFCLLWFLDRAWGPVRAKWALCHWARSPELWMVLIFVAGVPSAQVLECWDLTCHPQRIWKGIWRSNSCSSSFWAVVPQPGYHTLSF